jgi:hypothetical protein
MMASFNAIALLATNKPATSKAAGDVRCSTLCEFKSDITLSPRSAQERTQGVPEGRFQPYRRAMATDPKRSRLQLVVVLGLMCEQVAHGVPSLSISHVTSIEIPKVR